MTEDTRIAVAPPIQVGGSIFTPKQLGKIASIVGPTAKIEMTPFKQLYLEVLPEQRQYVTEELERSGLEVYPAGYVTKSLIACNFCKGGDEAGLETARSINSAIAGIETPTPLKVGYAGCALGTSEPLLKDISIIKMRDTYDIYIGGEPKGIKTAIAKKLLEGLKEEQLIPVVLRIINFYKGNAKGKEKFSKFVDRVSLERLQHIAG